MEGSVISRILGTEFTHDPKIIWYNTLQCYSLQYCAVLLNVGNHVMNNFSKEQQIDKFNSKE